LREGLRLLGRPTMALILLLSALHCVSDATMGSWFPIYAKERFGEALRHPGDVMALCGLAYVVSRSMLVFVPEGRGRRMLLVLPGLIGGGILLAAIWMDSPAALFWGYPLAAFVWSSQYPALMGEAARRTPRYVSSMFAVSMILALVATAAVTYGVGYFIKTASTTEAMVGALRWIVGAELRVPWWMPDHRWAITIAPLGFIIFGLVVAVTGLGRRKAQTAPTANAEA
ncbi:MAG: hypothetical protein QGH74_02800, partial [Candidatus Brocadiia bacterium]|nr:hypothetical protein [Candidatus Brocadiia bacterium]